jgi:DNA adenine methylase
VSLFVSPWQGRFIYCDPPYVHETRHESSRDVYGVEMTEKNHRELAQVLRDCKAKVVLSGYPSPPYDERLGTQLIRIRPIRNELGPLSFPPK